MVSFLKSDKKAKTVEITLDINNIFDIINGLNILVGQKEDEMNKFNGGDSLDKEQYDRYKKLLGEMQRVKAQIK